MARIPIIIDYNNVARRAIEATISADLQAGGVWTGGVFLTVQEIANCISFVEGVHADVGPVILCVDAGIPDERKKLIPEYKAERQKRRDKLSKEQRQKCNGQLLLGVGVLELLGCHVARVAGYEADDLCAWYAKYYKTQGVRPVVVSGDRDLLQVAASGFGRVLRPFGAARSLISKSNFEEMTEIVHSASVAPSDYLVYRALTGDASDGIKGVGGCGEKRASEFLRENKSGFHLDPAARLTQLYDALARKKSRKWNQWEMNFFDGFERLLNVARGIDVFGMMPPGWTPPASFARKLKLGKATKTLRRLRFRQILARREQYLLPYVRAADE